MQCKEDMYKIEDEYASCSLQPGGRVLVLYCGSGLIFGVKRKNRASWRERGRKIVPQARIKKNPKELMPRAISRTYHRKSILS
jgi:hypothetical protein